MTTKVTCLNCGEREQLSWSTLVRDNHDCTFALGCDVCSETLLVLEDYRIAAYLTVIGRAAWGEQVDQLTLGAILGGREYRNLPCT